MSYGYDDGEHAHDMAARAVPVRPVRVGLYTGTDVGPGCTACGTPAGRGLWIYTADRDNAHVIARCVCCHAQVRLPWTDATTGRAVREHHERAVIAKQVWIY